MTKAHHLHMLGLGTQTEIVPCVVVSGLGLGHLGVRLRLESMDDIREGDRILNEEDGDVVSDDIW